MDGFGVVKRVAMNRMMTNGTTIDPVDKSMMFDVMVSR
jgi:hypothetical protein